MQLSYHQHDRRETTCCCLIYTHNLLLPPALTHMRHAAGLILMQLAVPSLRTPGAFKAFNTALRANNCNLLTWRASARLSASQTAILDAEDGAGWDLAAALLQPRCLHVSSCHANAHV